MNVNFHDHPEMWRIKRWLESDIVPRLAAQYNFSTQTLYNLIKALNGEPMCVGFSKTMEIRILDAARRFEAEVNGGVKPALAEIRCSTPEMPPAKAQSMEELEDQDAATLKRIYAAIIAAK